MERPATSMRAAPGISVRYALILPQRDESRYRTAWRWIRHESPSRWLVHRFDSGPSTG